MKFSCKTSDLLTNIQLVNRAIGTEQVLPILQNILISIEGNICTLSATNLELSIVTSFAVNTENEGSITIPAKAIMNFVQYNQDDQIILETSEGIQLKLHSKRAKALISGESANGFPTITGIQKDISLELPTPPLLHALNLVTFACAKTNSRPVISGVFVRIEKTKLILVGTDSYRLSEYKIDIPTGAQEISCIIPARFLEELKGIIGLHRPQDTEEKGVSKEKASEQKMQIFLSPQQIEVHIGNTRLTSRLIEGKFPDYIQVLPKERHTLVSVSTKDLLSAVKRMHYFAKEQSNNITFAFSAKDGINLTTKQTQLGKDESNIIASIDGKDTKIAISSTYLIDFLGRISADTIIIELSDKVHPAVFKLPGSESYLHLIMPLRMNEE